MAHHSFQHAVHMGSESPRDEVNSREGALKGSTTLASVQAKGPGFCVLTAMVLVLTVSVLQSQEQMIL